MGLWRGRVHAARHTATGAQALPPRDALLVPRRLSAPGHRRIGHQGRAGRRRPLRREHLLPEPAPAHALPRLDRDPLPHGRRARRRIQHGVRSHHALCRRRPRPLAQRLAAGDGQPLGIPVPT